MARVVLVNEIAQAQARRKVLRAAADEVQCAPLLRRAPVVGDEVLVSHAVQRRVNPAPLDLDLGRKGLVHEVHIHEPVHEQAHADVPVIVRHRPPVRAAPHGAGGGQWMNRPP